MTAIQLYKFVTENKIDRHWETRDYKSSTRDVLIFPDFDNLQQLTDLLDQTLFDDGGIEVILKKGYLCIWMQEICDHYGIDIIEVFGNDEI